jgi:murein L,D-transpeptidase YcbB/YkuD
MKNFKMILGLATGTAMLAVSAQAQQAAPRNLLPPEPATVQEPLPDYTQLQADSREDEPRPVRSVPQSAPRAAPQAAPRAVPSQPTVADNFGDIAMESSEVVQELPVLIGEWSLPQAQQLAGYVAGIAAEGLDPADYGADVLAAAIAQGEGAALNDVASRTFVWLVEDLRDGRTPMEGRKQWFVMDPDADRMPTARLLKDALANGRIAETLEGLAPVHPDYALLKAELAATPKGQSSKRKLIRANMDRWRWLPQDLGSKYLMTNVPEFQVRLTVRDRIIKSYRTVVGKPGNTATPQLAEMVEGVIFNPTWTVPQSIVKGEGLGARVLGNPGWAKAQGYTATRGENGWVTVVQQPGPKNALGVMKLHMPNRHAIFLHDTPSRGLFANDDRALSHGCIRVENARELAMTMAMLGNMETKEDIPAIQREVEAITASGTYTAYEIQNPWPVYITYFTMARDVDGNLTTFEDIYGRDAAVMASFERPRMANRSRVQGEEIIPLAAPGA